MKGFVRTGTVHSLSRMRGLLPGASTRGIYDRADKQDLPNRVDFFWTRAIWHVTHPRLNHYPCSKSGVSRLGASDIVTVLKQDDTLLNGFPFYLAAPFVSSSEWI